jgi:hypothetical protein
MESMESHEPQSVPPPQHDTARLTPTGGGHVQQLGDPDFPTVRRGGYDPAAVDAYVAHAQRMVAELGAAATNPDDAVRQALDRVGEETAGILRHAQETAAAMISRSEAQASGRLESAERQAQAREDEAEQEAERLRVQGESEVRRLDADNDRLWEERQRLIDETRRLSVSLRRVAEEADQLFPPEPLGARTEASAQGDLAPEDEEFAAEAELEAAEDLAPEEIEEDEPAGEPALDDTAPTDEGAEPGTGRA